MCVTSRQKIEQEVSKLAGQVKELAKQLKEMKSLLRDPVRRDGSQGPSDSVLGDGTDDSKC